jgi:HAD superfamily hydrolase (TIGR01509 family)
VGERPAAWPAAVLWDLDGTLVDTEPLWMAAELALAEEHGASWSREQALQLVGNALSTSGRVIRDQMGLELSPAAIVDFLVDRVARLIGRTVPWRPGAVDLVAELRDAGVPCGLVTMSYRKVVDPVVAALPEGTFASVVTGDTVTHGKPHPEAYLRAAAELGLDPRDCLAIEDSDTGARSAAAAGCTLVVVPHQVPVRAAPGRHFAESLSSVDLRTLRGLGNGLRSAPSD